MRMPVVDRRGGQRPACRPCTTEFARKQRVAAGERGSDGKHVADVRRGTCH